MYIYVQNNFAEREKLLNYKHFASPLVNFSSVWGTRSCWLTAKIELRIYWTKNFFHEHVYINTRVYIVTFRVVY